MARWPFWVDEALGKRQIPSRELGRGRSNRYLGLDVLARAQPIDAAFAEVSEPALQAITA